MSARSRTLAVGLALGVAVGMPTVAFADDYPGEPPPEDDVLGTTLSRAPQVQGVTASRDPGLPVTGGDIAGLTMLGFGAVALGTVLMRRGRTRSTAAA